MRFRKYFGICFSIWLCLLFGACATPQTSSYQPTPIYTLTKERDGLKSELATKAARRTASNNAEEIARLEKEVRALEARIADLEANIASEERRNRYQTPAAATSSGCITGPNGGTYKISKSGKKNYGAC